MTISDESALAGLLPLTPMQQGMLFHSLREPDSDVYFQQLTVHLSGPLDPLALEQAWGTVMKRHDALRASGQWRADMPVPGFYAGECILPFSVLDYRDETPARRHTLRAAFLQADRAQGFALDRPPLLRITLLRWSDENWDMVWSHHHVLIDGWSSGLVLAEVVHLYEAALQGKAATLPTPHSFREFLKWLGRRDPLAAETWWRQALDGFEQPTPLPVLKRRAHAAQPAPVLAIERRLDTADAQELARLTHQAGVSAATPVIACWGLLLARYADSGNAVFGVTTSGRPADLTGSDDMVGLFINTIPLRVCAPRNGSVADWLVDVQNRLAHAREHEHTALTRIAEWSSVAPGQPLFETIVVYENYPLAVTGNRLGEAVIEGFHLEERPSFPLSLIAEPTENGLCLRLLADTSRIAAEAAERMLGQFEYLLQQLATATADQTMDTLRLLRPVERDVVLNQWNATEHPYDRNATLPSLFDAQAQRTPTAVALIDESGTLTYGELRLRVARLAALLSALDLAPCSPVGVRMGRDRDLIVALLAVVSAGHHYVPIEPQLPAARVETILDALPIRCILTHAAHLERTRELIGTRSLTLLTADAASDSATPNGLAIHAQPNDPAYVIFTSGSTGRPKGVLVKHTRAVNLIDWVNRTFKVGGSDRLLFITSPAFDLSVYDIFGMLAAGGSIRIANDADLADPQRLADILVNDGITFWDSAPAALSQLAPLLPARAAQSSLRLVFLSGDWIPLPLPDRMKQGFPGACVVALGGATEAAIWSNYHVIDAIDPDWASIPYGRPIQNARYYVLDTNLDPCPVGVPGDLFIGGECLAEGYVGQSELTAERFIHDPFAAKPGARMYRSGDRARFAADGAMEFLGRLDTQVKIRGFRIELGEIEAAMGRHPAVRDVICVIRNSGEGGPAGGRSEQEIIGYFVARPGHPITADMLRRYLAQQLPAPMIPAFLIPLDAVPLTSNGKVDRKNLPLPALGRQAESGRAPSGDAVRDTIASVWCEVLGLDGVSHDDDFFTLGGHSLRATSAVARLRTALGLDIPLRLIFEQPTIRGMADAIRDLAPSGGHDSANETAAIPLLDRSAGIPLSRAQRRLWFLHQLEPDSPNYNVALAARISGAFDVAAFSRAVAAVIERHHILNTKIVSKNQQPVMLPVDPDLPVPFSRIDLSAHPAADLDAQARRQLTLASRIPFALDRERPVRMTMIHAGTERAYVLILMDHIATDGWSIGLFAEELLAAYDADLKHETRPQPQGPQYADFAAWRDRLVEEKWLDGELAYWKKTLAGLQKLLLKTDHPRPSVQSGAGARLHFTLDSTLSSNLRRTAHKHSATLFMALLTAFDVLLRARSGQDDIVVGTDIAGRDHPLAERLIGFFVNQLVVRSDFSGCVSFADMLAQVRRRTLDGFFHQHVPFEALIQEINPVRDPGGMPLFQHKFVLQNAPFVQLDDRAFNIEPIEIDTGTAKYDLLLTVIDENTLRGTLEFSTDLFTTATAEALIREFKAVLVQVAADATVSYDSLRTMLDMDGEARADAARRELRRSGLQRLRNLTRPGATTP